MDNRSLLNAQSDSEKLESSFRYKHIFFDLDHTLWDFEANSRNTLKILFEEKLKNHHFSFDSFFKTYEKVNAICWKQYREGTMKKEILRVKRFADTFLEFGINDEDLGNYFADQYLEISPYQTQLFPGTISLLDYLKEKNYTLHIITNGFLEVQTIKITACNLQHYFEQIVISEQLKFNKPHPSVFQYAMKKAQAVPHNSLMVGDNLEVDILGAKNVGMDGVFFNPKMNLHQETVKFEVNSLEEIKSIL